ncbi:IclR family transcriptional regulator [Sphingomonas sp. CGMCC 1.13654]|uniref:IclR family transcriptional regulator n=1 Tax=Sphingomonas chungangi TaxID=2683589 RepID=A0A838LBE3_9SPHN|nr:IclR family transcriptional regulator [Sphingomonas chungangi]MBA2936561.1 IclR family transcriptional regulator [Sphingomonas chungangi]MVW55946.1 helix-turn-helix domain-containing protein [Sphingomonas chungangi]
MKSLETALRVLSAFASDQDSWGVGELAARCELTKGQVSKILATFRDSGFVSQDPATRRYSVGFLAFSLGSRFLAGSELVRASLPIMRGLVDSSGQSVRLSIVAQGKVVYFMGIEGPMLMQTGWRAGMFMPWHATSAGRVLLAYQTREQQNAILEREGLAKITPFTVVDLPMLRDILGQVARQGYSVVRNESTLGLGAIGAPVVGKSQNIIGVLSLAFPDDKVLPSEEPRLVRLLLDAAGELSLRSGAPVYMPAAGKVSSDSA